MSVFKLSLKFSILINLFELDFLSGLDYSFTPSEKGVDDIFNFLFKGFDFKQNASVLK